jgi:hypothetical protein
LKILLIGASGTLGKKVDATLRASDHQIVRIGRRAGDVLADLADPKGLAAVYEKLKPFDAVAIAAVQQALPYINDRGSFTLVGGLFSEEPIPMGSMASTFNRALEGFVVAAAIELPRGLRINLVSPGLLEESVPQFGGFAPGVIPVPAAIVAQAYKRSILGAHTGQIYKIGASLRG